MQKNVTRTRSVGRSYGPDDYERFFQKEGTRALVPLTRAPVQGFVKAVFWGLRLYIAVMLVLVAIGFSRGMH